MLTLCKGRWGVLLTALFVSAAAAQERVKSCAACHGMDGNSTMAGVPSLAGQPKVFLETQLVLTREGLRGGDVMQQLLRGVSDKEIVELASYYSRQALRTPQGTGDAALVKQGRELSAKHRCGTCHLADIAASSRCPAGRAAGRLSLRVDARLPRQPARGRRHHHDGRALRPEGRGAQGARALPGADALTT